MARGWRLKNFARIIRPEIGVGRSTIIKHRSVTHHHWQLLVTCSPLAACGTCDGYIDTVSQSYESNTLPLLCLPALGALVTMPSKKTADMSVLEANVIQPLNTFAKSSYYFLAKCEKPDSKRTSLLAL